MIYKWVSKYVLSDLTDGAWFLTYFSAGSVVLCRVNRVHDNIVHSSRPVLLEGESVYLLI